MLVLAPAVARCTSRIAIPATRFKQSAYHIAHVALISDDDIRNAQRKLWRDMQLVTEPGGAAAFAALLSGAYRPAADERVGVVVCGANTSMDVFGQLFS